ncbi:MAG: hypothetical protein P4L44_00435 [Oryzomonas sp.]|uniref:hypothetical protein n=1 Tax=Oryzomonas sp. TaxID=2855186 RepID=UPI0028408A69|nr:hypothetical protein [Oryzomonas sp.]MDR3578411.1 hypothetical protein [Oryzomonas sp.]
MDERQNPMHMVMIELRINQKNMVLHLSDFIVVPFFIPEWHQRIAPYASRHGADRPSCNLKAFNMPIATASITRLQHLDITPKLPYPRISPPPALHNPHIPSKLINNKRRIRPHLKIHYLSVQLF